MPQAAPSHGRWPCDDACVRLDGRPAGRVHPRLLSATLVVLAAVLLALTTPTADATRYQRPFKEVFGSAAQPTFEYPTLVAVDKATGDVLVGDRDEQTIRRFHADGTPAPFAALGTNVIDGMEAGGKLCAEEPASCDKTPQNGIEITGPGFMQIAIDVSGGITNGDIYVTQDGISTGAPVVDIFASDGRYLGQLTKAGGEGLDSPAGVTTDSTGAVYVTAGGRIVKYTPTANPPTDADSVPTFIQQSTKPFGSIVVGAGATAGSLFALQAGNGQENGEPAHVVKLDKETGEQEYTFDPGAGESLTVDPTLGDVIVDQSTGAGATEFDATGDSAALAVGRLHAEPGGQVGGLASDSLGDVYAVNFADLGIDVYGAPVAVPVVLAEPARNVTGTKAALTGSVNPEGLQVTECLFEYGETTSYGSTAPCEGSIPTDSSPHAVRLDVSGLEANGHTYHYRIVAKNAGGTEESADQTFVTADTVVTEAANELGLTTATLHGTVRPEGGKYAGCVFEYGLAGNAGFEHSVPCEPSATEVEPDYSAHSVSAVVSGLLKDTAYRFRLAATNAEGELKGEEASFTTLGPPQITEIRALNADQSSATLEAKVNPRGFATTYYLEWGLTSTYGNRIPANNFEPSLGAGESPTLITADLSGLASGTTYHYRIVATSSAGTTTSPDQELETLNSCGLPDGRCFELVSPPAAGPVAEPGKRLSEEITFQSAAEPGSLAYVVANGLPDSTRGDQVLYHGLRSSSGWDSTQLSPKIVVPSETDSGNTDPAKTLGLSEDLSCGLVESNQPLTSDPGTRLVVESGGANLYRHNHDGSYTAITSLPPLNPEAATGIIGAEYELDGFSKNCGTVVFRSSYRYPGVSVGGLAPSSKTWLYEWDEGALRGVGSVPTSSGEVEVAATAGTASDHQNVVSEAGSRVFFSAEREEAENPEELGKTGVFVREGGTTSRDLSLSETETPDEGATFQYASKDGSRVFFTANAGLTADSSPTGIDLYEYDLASDELVDLSVDRDAAGAAVAGFLGASRDGSHIYFVARGQLLPGRGRTFAQNVAGHTFSIYGEDHGVLSYAGSFTESDVEANRGATVATQEIERGVRVSPDGRFLLFQSRANVTGYESGGVMEAYLYDAAATTQPTVCLSCRQDGKPSVTPINNAPLSRLSPNPDPLYETTRLVERNGRPVVFFISFDRLAPRASEGDANLYEWSHGQVFLISTEPPGLRPDEGGAKEEHIEFADASPEGTDLYFATPASLTWEDGDGRSSVYDARVGGGFPEPASPASPCNATTEGSCQGAVGVPPAPVAAASATFAGSGNLVASLVPPAAPPKPKLTRGQQLAKALQACRHKYKAKAKRASCEKSARSRYGSGQRPKARARKKPKSRRKGK